MRALNQRLRDGLAAFPEVVLNSPADAVPEVLNFSENCIKSETMLPRRGRGRRRRHKTAELRRKSDCGGLRFDRRRL